MEAKLKAAEIAGEAIDNKTRLDIIKHEENIIAAERDARRQEQEAEEERVRVSCMLALHPSLLSFSSHISD